MRIVLFAVAGFLALVAVIVFLTFAAVFSGSSSNSDTQVVTRFPALERALDRRARCLNRAKTAKAEAKCRYDFNHDPAVTG